MNAVFKNWNKIQNVIFRIIIKILCSSFDLPWKMFPNPKWPFWIHDNIVVVAHRRLKGWNISVDQHECSAIRNRTKFEPFDQSYPLQSFQRNNKEINLQRQRQWLPIEWSVQNQYVEIAEMKENKTDIFEKLKINLAVFDCLDVPCFWSFRNGSSPNPIGTWSKLTSACCKSIELTQ